MGDSKPVVMLKSPFVSPLGPGKSFDRLTQKKELYAHHLAIAAWYGTRIILRQVSPESNAIFDFVLELYRSSAGDWAKLAKETGVLVTELSSFLEFSADFWGMLGITLYLEPQKDVSLDEHLLFSDKEIKSLSPMLYEQIKGPILASRPLGLGFLNNVSQSSYYPGLERVSQQELEKLSHLMDEKIIYPENTRVRKCVTRNKTSYGILQASAEEDVPPQMLENSQASVIRLVRGDHQEELNKVCTSLNEARKYVANSAQNSFLSLCIGSFRTGNIEDYKESQRIWVKDLQPSVEVILGFIEPYRDPMGVRAEFKGMVAVTDKDETKTLTILVKDSDRFIRTLPWCLGCTENNGKGPFEKELFEKPDFTSLHTLAYNSSIIFPGINLPDYNDIRQEVGFKNVMITNSMTTLSPNVSHMASFFSASEATTFLKYRDHIFYLWVVFHELLGHGTSKILTENPPGVFNFDAARPPVDPLSGRPVSSWYRPGQTWTRLFGDLATSVDECRAECVGAYLMSDMELLGMFGYTEESEIIGRDLEYNMYLLLGGSGLRALENYNLENKRWGQAHSRAHFAILRTLLAAGEDFLTIKYEETSDKLIVRVDRTKIATHGRPALSQLLMKLHIYRCTANLKDCRELYEMLKTPDETSLLWRRSLLNRQPARQVFVQPNTMIVDGHVVIKEYEASVEGVIRSWAERIDAPD